MRLLHLADLHLGKNIGNYSLIEDQRHGLNQILDIIEKENIDVVMIAGDIYDTPVPSSEALKLYSDFIEKIIFTYNKIVLAIAGNHDSGRRLDNNLRFFSKSNYHLHGDYRGYISSGVHNGEIITLNDEYGKVHFHLIPFMTISQANLYFSDEINTFTDVYRNLLKDKNYEDRNVLISHCYANHITEETEDAYKEGQKPLLIGGTDAMDAHLFLDFDYVALGHLHSEHFVVDPKIRYSGTFMKYSFDEVGNKKTVTIVDLTDEIKTRKVIINPLRDFRKITGTFEQIMSTEADSDDYIKFELTDELVVTNAMSDLKKKFPHAVSISYTNNGVFNVEGELNLDLENKDTLELFEEFYRFKMDEDMTVEQIEALKEVIN